MEVSGGPKSEALLPPEIATTNLRPDLVLWSSSQQTVYIIELTVPLEDAVEEAYERKSLKYAELAAEAEQHGWKAKVCPVKVGCRGFVGKTTTNAQLPNAKPSKFSQVQRSASGSG